MLRAVGTVLRGSLLAQAIGFAVLPLLTRLYTPADFGALQLYQSILAILLVTATMRYEIAILRAASPLELKSLLVLCCAINIAIGVLLTAALAVAAWFWAASTTARLPFVMWLLPLSFVISGTAQFVTYWVTREQAFATGANSKIAQSTGYSGTALTLGYLVPGPSGLVIADIAGKVASLAWLARWVKQKLPLSGVKVRLADLKQAARTFREFPLIAVPGGIVNAVGGVLTPIMVYATFSASVSGQYGLVERSLTLPVALIIAAVSQVFSAQIAEGLREGAGTARHIFHRYVLLLAGAGVIPIILLMAIAPILFAFIFGPEWVQAGMFARIIAPAYLLMLVAGGTNMTLMLLGMQKTQMIWEVGRLLAMIALWTLAQRLGWSADGVVLGHAVVMTLSSVIFLLMAEIGLRRYRPAQIDAQNLAAVQTSLGSIGP